MGGETICRGEEWDKYTKEGRRGEEEENTRGKGSSGEQGRCWTVRTRATKVADNEKQLEGEKNEEKDKGKEREMTITEMMRGRWTCVMDEELRT